MPEPSGSVILDANLLLVLVLGEADPRLIASHKRLQDKHYDISDYSKLDVLVSQFAELVLIPNVVTEVSNIADFRLKEPAVRQVGESLCRIVRRAREIYVPSIAGVSRAEFLDLGLTDSVLLHLVHAGMSGEHPTVITIDKKLINWGQSWGLDVVDYDQLR